jgi:glycosyltransferase involved in cell wall biosynthesis
MRISVICPVHNTPPDLLAAAAQSVLDGQDNVVELILVDDASTSDATRAELARLAAADPRTRLVTLARNSGQSTARNEGVRAAAGDWIGTIDADDLWLPGWTRRAAAVLAEHREARWIGGDYVNHFPDARREPAPSILTACAGQRLAPGVQLLRSPALTTALIGNAWLHLGGSLIRRDLWDEAGGYRPGLHYHEDCLFLVKLSVLADLYLLEGGTYGYRRGHESMMTSPKRLSREYVLMHDIARREPLLRRFRRELRWSRYTAYKGLALNNLLSGRHAAAMRFALQAWLIDVREVGDLMLFAKLALRRARPIPLRDDERYSRAERFVINGAP